MKLTKGNKCKIEKRKPNKKLYKTNIRLTKMNNC